jgi:hypothetical protein
MTDGAALLADEALPAKPIRQWVLALPFALRFLLATDPKSLTHVLASSTESEKLTASGSRLTSAMAK